MFLKRECKVRSKKNYSVRIQNNYAVLLYIMNLRYFEENSYALDVQTRVTAQRVRGRFNLRVSSGEGSC